MMIDYYLPERNYVYHPCNAEPLFRKMYESAVLFSDDYNGFLEENSPSIIRLLNMISKCRVNESGNFADRIHEYIDTHIDKTFSAWFKSQCGISLTEFRKRNIKL